MLKNSLRSLIFYIFLLVSPLTSAMEMTSQYAMVFFFRSDCPHCHSFATTLKQFERLNNIYTYDFSLDGNNLPAYPSPIPAKPEISQTFFTNPRSITVPATFLINVNTRKFVRVSIGDVSLQSLQQTYQNILNDPVVVEAMQ